jgi:hypothetical protein
MPPPADAVLFPLNLVQASWLIFNYQRVYCAGAHKHQRDAQSSNFMSVPLSFLTNVTITSQFYARNICVPENKTTGIRAVKKDKFG